MDRAGFETLLERLGAAWERGDAQAAADCFAVEVDYADPHRYHFAARSELALFFEPPPEGHHAVWHRILFDQAAQTGVVEYTYVGHHRYHGAAIVEIDQDGAITRWREWQHLDDVSDWNAYQQGAGG